MKKYTKEQFLEWIANQPDDRKLDMNCGGTVGNPNCECLLSAFLNDHKSEHNPEYICLSGEDASMVRHFEFSLYKHWDVIKHFETLGDAKTLKL